MNEILKKINLFKYKQNTVEVLTFVIVSVINLLILLQIFNIFYLFYPQNISINFWVSQYLKYIWIALAVCLGYRFEKRLINSFQSAAQMDKTCNLYDDSVTNAYEMITNTPTGNRLLISAYLDEVSQKIAGLKPSLNLNLFNKSLIYLFVLIFALAMQLLIANEATEQSISKFLNHPKPATVFQQKIEVTPGSISISKGANAHIQVLNPLEKAEYSIYYQFEDIWRTESILDGSKTFSNIDRSFAYYIQNQWSSSDTFKVVVLDYPNVKKISLKYTYPAYINKRTDYIEHSDGGISVPQFTEIEMVIETPETVSEANIVFADKSFQKMENHGINTWITNFKPVQSTSYHFSLTDVLGA